MVTKCQPATRWCWSVIECLLPYCPSSLPVVLLCLSLFIRALGCGATCNWNHDWCATMMATVLMLMLMLMLVMLCWG